MGSDSSTRMITASASQLAPGRSWSVFEAALDTYCRESGVGLDEALHRAADLLLRTSAAPGECEMDSLLHEARHRFRNELQVLMSVMRLRSRDGGEPTSCVCCAACLAQTAAVARLNDLIDTRRSARVDLADLLETLKGGFVEAFAVRDHVAIGLHCAPLEVRPETARLVVLAVNEALTNAVKHAFPAGRAGRVHIDVARTSGTDGIRLVVEDDGVGLTGTTRPGSGLSLIRSLAAGTGGTVEQSTGDWGHRLTCVFPLP